MIGKFLFFEEDSNEWKKDSTVEVTMRMAMDPSPPSETSANDRVATPTLRRSEEISTAYGSRNPEMAARVRRRSGGTPRFRRIRSDVVTGAQRLRRSRSDRMNQSAASTRTTGGGTSTRTVGGGSGGSGGGY